MRKTRVKNRARVLVNETYEGISLEKKVERVVTTNEAIDDSAPIIHTERKDGILPEYDVRADKWEIAQDAMNKVTKSEIAKSNDVGKAAGEAAGEGEQKTETAGDAA